MNKLHAVDLVERAIDLLNRAEDILRELDRPLQSHEAAHISRELGKLASNINTLKQ